MIKEYLILPYQTFYDARYGKVEHSKAIAEQLKSNFDKNVLPYPIPVLLSHENKSGKYGEVKKLNLKEAGLYAEMEFNADGEGLIKAGRYDYLSPAYSEDYMSKTSGQKVGAALMEISLTPMPAQPNMPKVVFEEGTILRTWSIPLQEEGDKMSEPSTRNFEAELVEKEAKIKKYEEQLKEKESNIKKLSDELIVERGEKTALKVKGWADGWIQKGKAPALVNKFTAKLLLDMGQEKFFDEILEEAATIVLKQFVDDNELTNKKTVDYKDVAKKLIG